MLDKKQRYLQIALNSSLEEAERIIFSIPLDKRIIIEAGTPLIKTYGVGGIRAIKFYLDTRLLNYRFKARNPRIAPMGNWDTLFLQKEEIIVKNLKKLRKITFEPHIVADFKCIDRGAKEVAIAKQGGANAVTVLGQAPTETLDSFIETCKENGIDSMIDMMNVEFPLKVLRQLKQIPDVVILHRGVDEEEFNREKEIPFHEIHRIKNEYDIMIAVAGGDTLEEARRAIFNDADIVVLWKSFYQGSNNTAKLAQDFLKEIR